MNELERLDELFGAPKWKDKYQVRWCDLCNCAYIHCEHCRGSTCNGHGCEKCKQDGIEFSKYFRSVECYLTPEEAKIYDKCLRLKKFILKTIPQGDKQIDWKKLKEAGELSQNDEEMFRDEIVSAYLEKE